MKNNMTALNNERLVQVDFTFLLYWQKKVFSSNPELKICFYLVTEFIT